jgi:hypothetical protein
MERRSEPNDVATLRDEFDVVFVLMKATTHAGSAS